jgi:hypothetical protein
MDHRVIVAGSRLDEQHIHSRVSRKLVGDDAAGRTGSNDHVVEVVHVYFLAAMSGCCRQMVSGQIDA